ncbi:probable leucine-rich repeat receptor-like protein kinase At1g68400 [Papaver somniferum]|uniref:probable leucine-rich repeat receptor-like protein kinase At1g68400 n=1 Tax=Papaver somniferum TaxID=3469 RepID=UPI000E7017C8|nr:probable leucine-rich repeat receptor-like protein kinase At1g68400 [Papaver somniferum]
MKLFCNSTASILIFFLFFSLSLSNPDFETLLQFKKSSDPFNKTLISWSNSSSSSSSSLCSWIGVTCNHERTRITQLVLENQNLTGSIEVLTQLTELRQLSLKYNNLSIPTDFSLSPWKNMKLLYLSHNQFYGKFPSGISELHRLHRIDLSYNQFTGKIPLGELIQLPNLLTIRLEMNSFTGSLKGIGSISSLIEFNVSRNDLEGEIPEVLRSFKDSSFEGNKNLCGEPLLNDCGGESQSGGQIDPIPVLVPPKPKKAKKLSKKALILITISYVGLIILMGFLGFLLCMKKFSKKQSNGKQSNIEKKKRSSGFEGKEEEEGMMVLFHGCLDLSVDDLLKSSAELLGKGSFGTTYKVMMNNGYSVVVKRIRERKKKEIDGFLKEIGGLRHKNVSSLRGYYSSKGELLLVYDYFSNGSLYSLLHGNRGPGRTPLDWGTRLKFASGVAEGLAFLHVANDRKLSHGNLTSANVVIDKENNACIADAALCHIFVAPANVTNNGYKAPELMYNAHNYRKLSQKCDVYSLGVILLEILTGKMAVYEGETSLAKWVQCVGKEEWETEVFDFELPRDNVTVGEMVCLFQIALLCVAQVPNDRPNASVVHKMIEDVKTKGRTSTTFVHRGDANNRSTDSSRSGLSDDALPTQNTSF